MGAVVFGLGVHEGAHNEAEDEQSKEEPPDYSHCQLLAIANMQVVVWLAYSYASQQ